MVATTETFCQDLGCTMPQQSYGCLRVLVALANAKPNRESSRRCSTRLLRPRSPNDRSPSHDLSALFGAKSLGIMAWGEVQAHRTIKALQISALPAYHSRNPLAVFVWPMDDNGAPKDEPTYVQGATTAASWQHSLRVIRVFTRVMMVSANTTLDHSKKAGGRMYCWGNQILKNRRIQHFPLLKALSPEGCPVGPPCLQYEQLMDKLDVG